MILVVAEQLNLGFLLQHQGHTLRSTRTVTEALQVLRTTLSAIQGVILDDRLSNSRLVTAFLKANAPELEVISWRVAERNSPFKRVKEGAPAIEWKPTAGHRYQYKGQRGK